MERVLLIIFFVLHGFHSAFPGEHFIYLYGFQKERLFNLLGAVFLMEFVKRILIESFLGFL